MAVVRVEVIQLGGVKGTLRYGLASQVLYEQCLTCARGAKYRGGLSHEGNWFERVHLSDGILQEL